ncbi:hypothetical protein Tco_0081312, partial [Tanacetum coccineum]
YRYIKNHKKTVKNGQARTRESEEYKAEAKKKPKNQSRSQKSQASVKEKSNIGQQKSTRTKIFHLCPSTFRNIHKWSLNPNGPHPDP